MTRWQPARLNAPSYFEHAARLKAAGAVIFGPHLDVNPDDPLALDDPLRMARRFAHSIARETGEPFAWGWYTHDEGLRPAVCAVASIGHGFTLTGSTPHGTVPA